MSTFEFHHDAGHGWLKVHVYDAQDVGLNVEDFTGYSYYNDQHLYLEEDVDAGRFLAAWQKALRDFSIREVYDGCISPIRSYHHIIPAREINWDEIPF